MMAPDSQSLKPVLGSSIAGTLPLGLMDSKGSFFRSPYDLHQWDHCCRVLWCCDYLRSPSSCCRTGARAPPR